jgi:UDP-glucuronate decarboxylase
MDLNDGRIITNVIKAGLRNEVLVVNGTGSQTRSFCYIDDMIQGLVKMMDSNEQGPINLGNPYCEFTINELIELYNKVSGVNIKIKYDLYDVDDPKQRKPDISLAKEKLVWEPKILLEEGLEKMICFSNEN